MPLYAPGYHLAQFNIARLKFPLDDPRLQGFLDRLDPVNARADEAAGFVWRYKTDSGDATELRPYDDDRIIINLSVWESLDALFEFTYREDHLEVLQRRRDWFLPLAEPHLVLWWVPVGHLPTVEEAKERLDHLAKHGPTPYAFTFRDYFLPDQAAPPAAATNG